MGFEQIFDNLAFKCMDALRKKIHYLVDILKLPFLDTCNVKHTLTLIIRIKLAQ